MHIRLIPLLLLTAPLYAAAQTQPAPLNLTSALEKINATSDPQQALSILNALPFAALPALHSALESDTLNEGTRTIILQALPGLHAHARAARLDAENKADLEWNLRTGLEAYKTVGQHNPALDGAAITALSDVMDPDLEKNYVQFKAAVDAGCTDPLVSYYAVRFTVKTNRMTLVDAIPLYAVIADDMKKSSYSTGRKFVARMAQIRAIGSQSPPPASDLVTLNHGYEEALFLLSQLSGDEHISPLVLHDQCNNLYTVGLILHYAHQYAFNQVYPTLQKLAPNDAATNAFYVKYLIDWAWDGRGMNTANNVTDNGWKLFNDRLKLAEQVANAGFNIDPTNGDCPSEMITISMGLNYERPVMEKWFSRAMLADPDNYAACSAKFTYLMPQWLGSDQSMLEFARECLKNGTPQNRMPILLAIAHNQIASSSGLGAEYLSRPDVWADNKAVYEKLLSDKSLLKTARSQYLTDRADYIRCAAEAKQWAAALDLMNQFGDEIDLQPFGGKALYNFYKKKAAAELAKTPA